MKLKRGRPKFVWNRWGRTLRPDANNWYKYTGTRPTNRDDEFGPDVVVAQVWEQVMGVYAVSVEPITRVSDIVQIGTLPERFDNARDAKKFADERLLVVRAIVAMESK